MKATAATRQLSLSIGNRPFVDTNAPALIRSTPTIQQKWTKRRYRLCAGGLAPDLIHFARMQI